jgi:Uncharacterised nucleotidyltransferase
MAVAEFDLLCRIVRPRPDLAHIRERIAAGIDFEMLADLAEAHGVRPAFLLTLAALSWEGVPEGIRAVLRRFQQTHLMRTLALAEEACRVGRLFSDAGIRFAVFKGPALAAYLYGDLSRRQYSDIDVIVPPEQTAKAEALLASLGYGNRQGDRTFRQAFLSFQRQYSFTRPGFDFAIDLHWHFSGRHVPFPLQPEEVWSSLVSIEVGACTVPSLSDADLALLLAGHGTKESWKSVAWVCDFAMLIDRKSDLDWAEVHRRAQRQRCGDAVLLGCAMAWDLLATPVPASLSAAVAGNARVERIAASLIASMREGLVHFPKVKPNLLDIDLCERRIDRLRLLASLAVTPTPSDYHALPLPRALWSTYYLIRPVRQVLKAVRRRA